MVFKGGRRSPAEDDTIDVTAETVFHLLPPMLAFLPAPDKVASASSDLQTLRGPDLRILRNASQLLETFTLDSPAVCKGLPSLRLPIAPPLQLAGEGPLDVHSVLNVLLLFIEQAEPPAFWALQTPSESQIMSPVSPISPAPAGGDAHAQPRRAKWATKIGMCKVAAVKAVVEVCAEVEMGVKELEAFWLQMRSWLGGKEGRDDLVACALLCLGNAAREGEYGALQGLTGRVVLLVTAQRR